MLKVEKISIVPKTIKKTPELDKIVESMKKHHFGNGYDMLPKSTFYEVDCELHNTYAGFANGLRRAMISEIDVLSLECNEKYLKSDDTFITGTSDVLIKNLALVPINQDIDLEEFEKYTVYLLVANKTNDVIDIKASDITIGLKSDVNSRFAVQHSTKVEKTKTKVKPTKKTKKGGKVLTNIEEDTERDIYKGGDDISEKLDIDDHATTENLDFDATPVDTNTKSNAAKLRSSARHTMVSEDEENANRGSYRVPDAVLLKAYHEENKSIIDITKLIPDPNIIIVRLRPGKTLYISEINFMIGKGFQHYGKFSLLDNIRYEPLDIIPYDAVTNTGTRSIEQDATKFRLGFTTSGNIKPKHLINLVTKSLVTLLTNIRSQIVLYSTADVVKYYNNDDLEVIIKDDIYKYNIQKQYFTAINMITQKCFILDSNILLCTGGVDRYDTRVGVIKLKHADPNKLLIKAIDSCLGDLKIFEAAFK
jgi:hypothetical protein